MTFFIVFGYASLFTATAFCLWGFFNKARISYPLRPIVWLFLISTLGDVVSLLLSVLSINNLAVGNSFTIFQYAVLFRIFDKESPNQLLKFLFVLSVALGIYNLFFFQSPLYFNSYTFYAATFILLVSGIRYLYSLVKKLPVDDVRKVPMVWLTFGTVIYYAGTTFIFLFSNYLVANFPAVHQKIWVLHNLLGITKNIMFFIALWVDRKRTTSLS